MNTRQVNRTIILASQSPRRQELLTRAGFQYEVEPSQLEEQITKQRPSEVVMELSKQKAMDIYRKHMSVQTGSHNTGLQNEDSDKPILVIGADTVVSYQGRTLGKPDSEKTAYDMLKRLQGNTHQVYTGVALIWNEADGMHRHIFCEETKVTFYPMKEQEILDYISSGDCMDKAGAYGIQTQFGVYIKSIAGDYNNVVGLPIARLYQEMKQHGLLLM